MTAITQQPLAIANPWGLVPSLGNLDAYITAANRLPMLTPEQEQEFARQLKNNNDLEAAGKLVLSHLRLVVVGRNGEATAQQPTMMFTLTPVSGTTTRLASCTATRTEARYRLQRYWRPRRHFAGGREQLICSTNRLLTYSVE